MGSSRCRFHRPPSPPSRICPVRWTVSSKSRLDLWVSRFSSHFSQLRLDPDAYKPRNSRAVLMVIDALRTDFVAQRDNMRFLSELLANGSACQYQLQVHPPTVTMPRIKAITSGAIPSFLDVILNLGSPQMKLDTFLYQMQQKQRRVVFYGDNTWTSMFPGLFARQGENVDSLYVNDFYEVSCGWNLEHVINWLLISRGIKI